MSGYQLLLAAGKPELFAGVFVCWESNTDYGYRSLSYLGFDSSRQPPSLADGQAIVTQRHVALWAQYLHQAGIPINKLYSHFALNSVPSWIAGNPYSSPGWTNYVNPPGFTGIYAAVGNDAWAQAEGSNVVLGPQYPDNAGPSPYGWESYLAASYNHRAAIVTIYGAFGLGAVGQLVAAATGIQAVAAYRKFLTGSKLVESEQVA